jgi:hypothetical protein
MRMWLNKQRMKKEDFTVDIGYRVRLTHTKDRFTKLRKGDTVLITAVIIGIAAFLYWHNYNEAESAMSLMTPADMLVYAQSDSNETDRIKASTNYDKILKSIVDECSVKSMSLNNEMTLLERIGCIEMIDKIIIDR